MHVLSGIASVPEYVRVTEKNQFQALSHRIKEISPKGKRYSVSTQTKKGKGEISVPHAPKAVDLLEASEPGQALMGVYRIIRDTEIARWVKYIHEYKCQICGKSVELRGGQKYAEAHHIKPLGAPHNGPDVVENIISVCPNHHAQLDYGAIRLNVADLILVDGHEISGEYVEYHNAVVFK